MSSDEQQRLFENTARNMQGVTKEVQLRHINNCYKADANYGIGVANALGISLDEIEGYNG